MTISMTEGGIRMPSVPPAAMAPADMRASYPDLVMIGAAMMPSTVTAAPTMPVAIANTVAVRITPRYSEPRTGARRSRNARNSLSIRPACSVRKPMKMNSGIATSSSVFIMPRICR